MLLVLTVAVATLGVMAAITYLGVAAIERSNPPTGRFVDVDGGRLHVVELGLEQAPPVVLLHGASGNLGDMRLALGERLAAAHRVILIDRPGHGWSSRFGGRADASPARQAELIHRVLETIGVRRAVMVGHSWSGALATAYALNYPDAVAGLLLLAPVTHPWPGGLAWYHHVVTAPVVGPLFAHTLAYPIGKMLIGPGVGAVFAPQEPPPDYVARAGAEMVLRPAELTANAEDILGLHAFVTARVPRYPSLRTPTVIITGDTDDVVSPVIHARAIAAAIPNGRLIVLPGVGHMVHFNATARILETVAELSAERRAGASP